jgi:hypothetical protein
MRTEKEIRELKEKIEKAPSIDGDTSFCNLTDKGGHWLDCLDWVLNDKKKR